MVFLKQIQLELNDEDIGLVNKWKGDTIETANTIIIIITGTKSTQDVPHIYIYICTDASSTCVQYAVLKHGKCSIVKEKAEG